MRIFCKVAKQHLIQIPSELWDEYFINWMIYGSLDYQAGRLSLLPVTFHFASQQSLLSKESKFGIGFTITSSIVNTDEK